MSFYFTYERPDPCIRLDTIATIEARYSEIARTGQGHIFFLAGDSGCGRSATLRVLAERLREQRPRPFVFFADFAAPPPTPAEALTPSIANLIGQILPLAVALPNPVTALVLSFVGQLLQASASAYAVGMSIGARGQPH